MTKVYIDKDTNYTYFMWDKEILDILPQPEHILVDVPESLLYKYAAYQKLQGEIYQELEKYYKLRTNK